MPKVTFYCKIKNKQKTNKTYKAEFKSFDLGLYLDKFRLKKKK